MARSNDGCPSAGSGRDVIGAVFLDVRVSILRVDGEVGAMGSSEKGGGGAR